LETTVNFDVISKEGDYLGGAIAVGIGMGIEALFHKTARLPLVEFRPPKDVVGTNTVGQHAVGPVLWWRWGRLTASSNGSSAKMGAETRVIATGGQAQLIASGSRYLKTVDEHLTLEGLQMIWSATRPGSAAAVNEDWVHNYFNYFTEIEEHFQRARGTGLFLLSPLDWALIETGRTPACRSKRRCAASTPPSRNGAGARSRRGS